MTEMAEKSAKRAPFSGVKDLICMHAPEMVFKYFVLKKVCGIVISSAVNKTCTIVTETILVFLHKKYTAKYTMT